MTSHALEQMMDLDKSRFFPALVFLAVGVAAACLYALNPANSAFFPACPFKALTGLYCPGCGTLRGLHLLVHGEVAGAVGKNVLMVLTLPYILYSLACYGFESLGITFLPRVFVRAGWIWGLLIVVVLFGVLRNVPAYPFTLLAP